jgi:hypothetical protein
MNINFSDQTWRELEAWAQDKLCTERKRNDSPKLDASDTAFCRGRIAAFTELLALPVRAAAQAKNDEPQ